MAPPEASRGNAAGVRPEEMPPESGQGKMAGGRAEGLQAFPQRRLLVALPQHRGLVECLVCRVAGQARPAGC